MRKWKRIVGFLLAAIMVFMISLSSITVHADEGEEASDFNETEISNEAYETEGMVILPQNANVGDIIKFGKYEQDGNLENGKEDIEWEVLSVEENRVLVISKYALDCYPYNIKQKDVTWETCSLRKWLNNDFINTAFNATEKNKIPTVTLENKDNPKFGTHGGNKTNDKLFLLSVEEMEKYYAPYNCYDNENMRGYNQKLICEPTQYALNRETYAYTITEEWYYSHLKDKGYTTDVIGRSGCYWWFRSPGNSHISACNVGDCGIAGAGFCYCVTDVCVAVRPALYIEIDNQMNFDDVHESDWFYKAVKYVYENGIMAGVNGGKSFDPHGKLTREQFTQVLYAYEGKPNVTNMSGFTDVNSNAWYAKSVYWAKEKGITGGKPDGTFGVGENISRQDLAVMLYTYARVKGYDLTKNDNAIDNFTDKGKVSNYAKDAMKWAVTQGVISGKGNGKVDPLGNATRAECATMVMKLIEKNK